MVQLKMTIRKALLCSAVAFLLPLTFCMRLRVSKYLHSRADSNLLFTCAR